MVCPKKKQSPSEKEIAKPTEEVPFFQVVGIGVSAGGLDALEQFFRNIPIYSGMAYLFDAVESRSLRLPADIFFRSLAEDMHDKINNYVRFLAEVEILFRELLIGVTSFFRDPFVWIYLADVILPDGPVLSSMISSLRKNLNQNS